MIQIESAVSRTTRLAIGKGAQSTCYVPGSGVRSLESGCTSSHPPRQTSSSSFLEEETEGWRGKVTCPRSVG